MGQLFAITVGNLVVANVSAGILVVLSAVDVIHALAIPGLGVKADAIPGRLVHVKILSSVNGSFSGQCSELCGAMHAFMPATVALVLYVNI